MNIRYTRYHVVPTFRQSPPYWPPSRYSIRCGRCKTLVLDISTPTIPKYVAVGCFIRCNTLKNSLWSSIIQFANCISITCSTIKYSKNVIIARRRRSRRPSCRNHVIIQRTEVFAVCFVRFGTQLRQSRESSRGPNASHCKYTYSARLIGRSIVFCPMWIVTNTYFDEW